MEHLVHKFMTEDDVINSKLIISICVVVLRRISWRSEVILTIAVFDIEVNLVMMRYESFLYCYEKDALVIIIIISLWGYLEFS